MAGGRRLAVQLPVGEQAHAVVLGYDQAHGSGSNGHST